MHGRRAVVSTLQTCRQAANMLLDMMLHQVSLNYDELQVVRKINKIRCIHILYCSRPSDSINELQKYTSALGPNLPAAATSPAVRHPRSVKHFFKYYMYNIIGMYRLCRGGPFQEFRALLFYRDRYYN